MKKALVLLFDGYAEFEVHLAAMFLKSKGFEIETTSVDSSKKPIEGTSGMLSYPTTTWSNLENPDQYDVFIIPGGDITTVMHNKDLLQFTATVHESGGLICGICAGTSVPALAGLLDGKPFSTQLTADDPDFGAVHEWEFQQEASVTVANRVITSPGNAYVEFASAIIKHLDLYDPGEEQETIAYFKNERVNENV